MSLFEHGEPEEFLLFICNFNMTLAATGKLEMDVKVQYIHTLVHGEALFQFDLLSVDIENTETLNVDYYIKGLACIFPCEFDFKTKAYLDSLMGSTLADKIDVTESNEIILNIMSNRWSKQAYVQGFGCESTSFKNHVKMFESMEITEYIYKGVVEPYYKKTTGAYANCAGHSRNNIG